MDVTPLNFWDHFRSQSNAGRLYYRDQRLLLCSPGIFGRLRKELLTSIGEEGTRRLFLQAGFSTGKEEAEFLRRSYPEADRADLLKLGRFFQTQKGWAVSNAQMTDFDPEADPPKFKMRGAWRYSFEAETHLAQVGPSDIPVCWFLTGYLSGFASQVMGRRILYAESHCQGEGDTECRWLGKPDEAWGEKAQAYRDLFEGRPVSIPVAAPPSHEAPPIPAARVAVSAPVPIIPIPSGDPLEEALQWASETGYPILLWGDAGADLETPARLIHERSAVASGPFVPVYLDRLPARLLEGGLRPGGDFLKRARRGTVCLHGIDALPLDLQDGLLNLLQQAISDPPPEEWPRFLLTTATRLADRVRFRRFRRDLYRFLRPGTVRIPSLSSRPSEILRLADRLLTRSAAAAGKRITGFAPDARRLLADYAWPGHLRELEETVERAVLLAEGDRVTVADLPGALSRREAVEGAGVEGVRRPLRGRPGRRRDLYDRCAAELLRIRDEGRRIQKALDLSAGRLGQAAALLGISRITLWRKLRTTNR